MEDNLTNPNEYDDDAFLEASLEVQNTLPVELDGLWNAGASLSNVESELANALENTDFWPGGSARVSITVSA